MVHVAHFARPFSQPRAIRKRRMIASSSASRGRENVDRFANRDYRKMFVVMEIAHLRDPDSVPGFRQTREGNFNPHQPWMIGFKNRTLGRYGQSASRKCGFKEVPSIKEL